MKKTLLSTAFCICFICGIAQNNCGISNLKLDDRGFVSWTGQQSAKGLIYQLEQYRWHKWVKVAEVDGRPGSYTSSYGIRILPYHGINTIRIRTSNPDCTSDSIMVDLHEPEVTCKKNKKKKEILFSPETLFEIIDAKGVTVKHGYGAVVCYSDLPKGTYTLNYDNESMAFKH
jgi:hypothetical protein